MKRIIAIAVISIMTLSFTSCFYRVDSIKAAAEKRVSELGFNIVGREGVKSGIMGGKVWYVIKRPDSSALYHACLAWMLSGDLGVYNLETIDGTRVKIEGQ